MQSYNTPHLKTRRFLKFSDTRVDSKRHLETLKGEKKKREKKAVAVTLLLSLKQSRAWMYKRVATGAVR